MSDLYDSVTREEMLARCVEDRTLLMSRVRAVRPDLIHAQPYELVKAAIRSVCGFRVAPRVLVPGQLALCDFQSKVVYYNSQLESLVGKKGVPALLTTTLAHELGHIRLHSEEMESRCTKSYLVPEYGLAVVDGRGFQREREADLYAMVFLVPGSLLVNEPSAKMLYSSHKGKRQVKSSVIWRAVIELASRFQVTQTLMKNCLVSLGWIERVSEQSGKRDFLNIRWG